MKCNRSITLVQLRLESFRVAHVLSVWIMDPLGRGLREHPPLLLFHRRSQIRMPEIITLEQNRFALHPRQRIAEAIAKIQIRRMPAAFAVIPISLPRNLCLFHSHRFNLYPGILEDLSQPCGEYGFLYLLTTIFDRDTMRRKCALL